MKTWVFRFCPKELVEGEIVNVILKIIPEEQGSRIRRSCGGSHAGNLLDNFSLLNVLIVWDGVSASIEGECWELGFTIFLFLR